VFERLPVSAAQYVLEGEQGRGALGRVMRAHDGRLRRTVAMKVLLRQGRDAEARFLREARITARLQHPGIVPVYEVGLDPAGEPYYAMKLIAGRPLRELIADAGTLGARLALVPHVLAVADAIAYAHSQGIVHRDLKPANIIVGEFAETIVIDWGLAKDLRAEVPEPDTIAARPYRVTDDPTHTALGTILGTPAYMAPEQARGDRVDERADVYALGAVLYHVLSGEPPFSGDSKEVLLAHVRTKAPVPLQATAPGVSPDLVAIVNKAMQWDARLRYSNAAGFAADLRAFLTGKLVDAHTYTTFHLVRRWLKANRRLVAVGGAAVALLALVSGLSVLRIIRERNAAENSRDAMFLAQASSHVRSDPTASLAWILRYPDSGATPLRARDITASAIANGYSSRVLTSGTGTLSIRFASDGRLFYTDAPTRSLHVWDTETGSHSVVASGLGENASFAVLQGGSRLYYDTRDGSLVTCESFRGQCVSIARHTGTLRSFEVSAAGSLLVYSGANLPPVLLSMVGEGARVNALTDVGVDITALSPDGKFVAGCSMRGELWLWRVPARAPTRLGACLRLRTDYATMRFAPMGNQLAVAEAGGQVRIWHLEDQRSQVLLGHESSAFGLRWNSSGTMLLTGDKRGTAILWDTASGRIRRTFQLGHPVRATAMSDDGRYVAIGGASGEIILSDTRQSVPLRLSGHRGPVADLAFSPSGDVLASSDHVGTLRLWPASQRPNELLLSGDAPVYDVAYSPLGDLAVAGKDAVPRLWPAGADTPVELRGHTELVLRPRFSPAGDRLATVSWDKTARIWSRRGQLVRVLRGHDAPLRTVEFSPDGQRVVTADAAGVVWIFSATNASSTSSSTDRLLGTHEQTQPLASHFLDRDHVLSIPFRGDPKIWAVDGHNTLTLDTNDDPSTAVAVSSGGDFVAIGSTGGAVRVFAPLRSPQPLDVVQLGRAQVRLLQFSPDTGLLAAATKGGELSVVDMASRRLIWRERLDVELTALAFANSGAALAATARSGQIYVIDVHSRGLAILNGHTDMAQSLAYSPDDRRLVSASFDGTVIRWFTPSFRFVPTSMEAHKQLIRELTSFRLDGERVE
jgi:WD40 repeat protein